MRWPMNRWRGQLDHYDALVTLGVPKKLFGTLARFSFAPPLKPPSAPITKYLMMLATPAGFEPAT